MWNQVMRLNSDVAATGERLHGKTLDLLNAEGNNRARVAEILAKGQVTQQVILAAAQTLQQSNAASQLSIERRSTAGNNTDSYGTPPPPPKTQTPPPANVGSGLTIEQVFTTRCISCHNSEKKGGGLDLSDISALDATAGDKILRRITHDDPTKRMPLASTGDPGVPLSLSEVKAVFKAAQY